MATLAVRQIEKQIAHLSPEDQLNLLERLVQHFRVIVAETGGFREETPATSGIDPGMQRELDRLGAEYKSAESDLLNDVW